MAPSQADSFDRQQEQPQREPHHEFYKWQQQQQRQEEENRRRQREKNRRRQARGTTKSDSDLWTWKTFCLAVGLLHYAAWVTTLVCCSPALLSSSTANGTIPTGFRPSLFFPLDVYAWSVGQSLSTLGVLRPLSEVLTRESWKSFERRDRTDQSRDDDDDDESIGTMIVDPIPLPPLEIPVLNVRDFLGEKYDDEDGSAAALSFLRTTYGPRWYDRPLLLKGLWTMDELLSATPASSTTTNDDDDDAAKRRRRRRLTPEGLLDQTDLIVPYFSDSSKLGALEPDATDSVGDIVRGMIEDDRPHKIGSQFVVQSDPSLMEEVAPPEFVTKLFGNHFSPNHLMGNPHRTGIHRFLPGTTTVPLFVANTLAVRKRRRSGGGGSGADGSSSSSSDGRSESARGDENRAARTGDDGENEGSCRNPHAGLSNEPDENGERCGGGDSIPVTGLHCEPIANVAVQLWGSRTWTLVDPEHSLRKLRPSISKDGRSFYPSWISVEQLRKVPRYRTTTTPGDALWLPTWTYHKVDYVYHSDNDDETMETNDHQNSSRSRSEHNRRQQLEKLHGHHLSIGASLFHFRPIDYVRRNPLFALLLIPSLIRELAGIKTQ